MRRKDREMDREFALKAVDQCKYGVLAMTLEGAPYCVPLSIVRDGDNIYFHSAMDGAKTNALRAEPRVCLTCVGSTHLVEEEFTTEYESAIVFGSAAEVTEEAEKTAALKLICKRYAPSVDSEKVMAAIGRSIARTAIWRIGIESVTGKRKKYGADGKELKFGKME